MSVVAKHRLYAPGPVEVPPRVLEALARPVLHHRSPEFRELFLNVRAQLSQVFMVGSDEVVVLTGSGSAAFEAALLACVPADSEVLCLVSGRFGERWARLSELYGFTVDRLLTPAGAEVDLAELEQKLRQMPGLGAVTVVHSETSTGSLNDVAAVAALVRTIRPDALVVVDAVTSLGVAELRPREWQLDAVVAGSQKGLMAPPGLSFAWLSERAWTPRAGLLPSAYLSLRAERKAQREGYTAVTPAVSLVAAVAEAMALILETGLERHWRHKAALNDALLAAGSAAGMTPLARRPAPALAALLAPEGVSAPALAAALRRRGMTVGDGQDGLKERLIRPSLMGWADRYDAVLLAAALEESLREVGWPAPPGAAATAALTSLAAAELS